jgi:hypothetical protein
MITEQTVVLSIISVLFVLYIVVSVRSFFQYKKAMKEYREYKDKVKGCRYWLRGCLCRYDKTRRCQLNACSMKMVKEYLESKKEKDIKECRFIKTCEYVRDSGNCIGEKCVAYKSKNTKRK